MRKSIDYIKEVSQQSSLRRYFKKVQQTYNRDINLALYTNLTKITNLNIFQIIPSHDQQNFIIHFYGFRMMNLTEQMSEELHKLFIREIDSYLRQIEESMKINDCKKKYSIILFVSGSEGKSSFDVLKDIYKKLPAVFFFRLHKIYVIQPGFLIKSLGLFNFTSWSKLFYKYVEYVERIEDIQQIPELKVYNILSKCPKQITKDIKIVSQSPRSRQIIQQKPNKPKPFDCLKRQFNQYSLDEARKVPLILSILIETMKNDKNCCLIQGIFRSAASIEDQEQILKYAINLKTFRLLDSEEYCKRAISGLIKKIFTLSNTPLIPYHVYNQILHKKLEQNEIIDYWKTILLELPTLNQQILCYVIQFIRDWILSHKDMNKMNSYNLSVVFTPCFFRSKQTCLSDLINSGKFAALFKNLLEKYDEIVQKDQRNYIQSQKQEQTCGECCFFENQKINQPNIFQSKLFQKQDNLRQKESDKKQL